MATKHTPGPWCIETPMGEDTPWIVEAGKQSYEWHCIAMVPVSQDNEDDLPVPVAKANARLIAAAPEMLAALKAILAGDEASIAELEKLGFNYNSTASPENRRLTDLARVAIAKAEGRSS